MQRLATSFVLAYHGCDRELAERLVAGEAFELSTNVYDWLGHGAYFWEADPVRGLEWARELQSRGKVAEPAVVGVALDLGLCLDLMTRKSLLVLGSAYDALQKVAHAAGEPMPVNKDEYRRDLDCSVINYLYREMAAPKFQTVRAAFPEGGPLFPGSHVSTKTHIQIAVRDLSCIKGVFRVPEEQLG